MKWTSATMPWFGQELEEMRELMGEYFWPFGIEANRTSLAMLFQYSHEQALTSKRLTIEELFHTSILEFVENS